MDRTIGLATCPDDTRDDTAPRCPVCDAETDTLYRNDDGDIVGCSECLHLVDAWEWEEETRDY